MKNNTPKHIAFKTLIKNKHYLLNRYIDLQHIIESNQFMIIEYKKHANSEHVTELIKRLRVEKEIEQNDSFLYIKNNLKFVFINADNSDVDKCSLLRHELGHICDPNFKSSYMHYSRIKKEEFANEFSCYIKNPGICFITYMFIIKNWKQLFGLILLIICILGFLFINNSRTVSPSKPETQSTSSDVISESISEDVYYVTPSGKKYHKNNCIIVKYKNNLTELRLNDAVNRGYSPCLICNPGE